MKPNIFEKIKRKTIEKEKERQVFTAPKAGHYSLEGTLGSEGLKIRYIEEGESIDSEGKNDHE
tara:strand:+ start:7845 stop:8033 length:189 start_codon:yes stop_codon:yes gene_type:complete